MFTPKPTMIEESLILLQPSRSGRNTRLKRLSRSSAIALALLVGVVAGCGGDNDTAVSQQPAPAPAPPPAAAAGDFVSKASQSIPAATAAGSVELMIYRMPGVDGSLRQEQALVLLPASEAPTGGYPMVIWGHGTTGVNDLCAPSATTDMGGVAAYINLLVAQGFAIVAPDYEGLGTDGLHHYLNLQSEARSMLYAGLAATKAYGNLSTSYVTLGHSQGGHAALGAAELAGEVPALNLVGAIGLAPASNIDAQGDVLQSIIDNPLAPIPNRVNAGVARVGFASLILAGLQAQTAAFNLPGAFGVSGQFIEQAVVTQCTGPFFAGLAAPVQAAITIDGSIASLVPPATFELPEIVAYLAALEPGQLPIAAPVLLIQGQADTTVFATSSQALLATYIGGGTAATLSLAPYPASTHGSIVSDSLTEVLAFLATQFAAAATAN